MESESKADSQRSELAGNAPSSPSTHMSLINGMVRGDREARERFFNTYVRHMYAWCVSHGLSEHDAEDVIGDLTLKLMLHFENGVTFDRSRRFRPWLRTVVGNAVRSFWRQKGRVKLLEQNAISPKCDERSLAQAIEDRLVYAEAIEIVRAESNPQHFAIYLALTEEHRDPGEVAESLGVKRAFVYSMKQRVKEALKRTIETM